MSVACTSHTVRLVARLAVSSLALAGVAVTVAGTASPARASSPSAPPTCTSKLTTASNPAAVAIPTGPAVVTSTVVVAGAGAYLFDVDAVTGLQHAFSADLDVTLTSPAGTVVTLTTDNGGGNDNVFDGTRWDDDANPTGQVPYTTNDGMVTDHAYVNLTPVPTLAPEEPLAAFVGENPNGTWTLTISDDVAGDGGNLTSWSLDLTTLPTAPQVVETTTASSNVVTAIPTGPAVISQTVAVSGARTYLSDVDVVTGLQHTFSADLDVTLTSPAGTVVTLTTDNGGGNDNVFDGTRWDDDANPTGQVPYTTNDGMVTDHAYVNLTPVPTLAPEEPLGAFVGENPNGTWTLTVSDDLAGDGGSLNSVALQLKTSACDTAVTGVTTSVKKRQKVSGKGLKVKSQVAGALEQVTVKVSGKVKIKGGKSYQLRALTKAVAKGGTVKLQQTITGNKRKVANANAQIALALSRGKKVSATLSFVITDQLGNVLKVTKKAKIT